MKRDQKIGHEFVEFIPEVMRAGVVYVSVHYATASHLCACGCGSNVVTPITPTDWKLEFDGASISLDPSIGNWSFPCQSHYWVRNGRIRWAAKWSKDRIEAGRAFDFERKTGKPEFEKVETGSKDPWHRRILKRLMLL